MSTIQSEHEGWEPIETAPRDGKPILAWPHYIITRWATRDLIPGAEPYWTGRWNDDWGEDGAWDRLHTVITHWRPLPPPPGSPPVSGGGPSPDLVLVPIRAREQIREAVHAWIRDDLDTGAQMLIGFHGQKLFDRLDAMLSALPAGGGGGGKGASVAQSAAGSQQAGDAAGGAHSQSEGGA